MPTKKKGDPKTAAEKLAAKSAKRRAANIKAGKKLETKAAKIGAKGEANRYSPKRRKQAKGIVQRATAANMSKAGKAIQKSKGQGTVPKKKNLRVSKKSMHKQVTGGDTTYTGRKKDKRGRK